MSVKERLKAKRIVTPVEVAGDTFHVRGLTLGEIDACDARAKEFPDEGEQKIEYGKCIACLAICEADGTPAFADVADPDINEIGTDVLRILIDAAAKANGMTREEDEGKG